ncbi:hypothetical protein RhiXN_08971 [Rhizoctonia solani]|uniref:Uncharacterized protein n=1 Tax=Rhizoctonia solani TaxID=456999 RepID=A0A8H8NU00_9AGAM|nr:uncharacterized protein RhiXN_08971 [Rhizoctonia solani]QRW19996.1 hypothetical protein RhiXN_08971 [Rhizoctonia solani]
MDGPVPPWDTYPCANSVYPTPESSVWRPMVDIPLPRSIPLHAPDFSSATCSQAVEESYLSNLGEGSDSSSDLDSSRKNSNLGVRANNYQMVKPNKLLPNIGLISK